MSKRSDGKLSYSNTPTELFIVCGGSTYSMIAYPGRLPSQTIKLSSGLDDKIRENISIYSGIPFEKRLMKALKDVFTDSIPESYSVVNRREVNNSWKSISVALRREVDIEGEGIKVREFSVTLKPGQGKPFKLSEKMFLRKEFAINPVAVSIDKHVLRPGEVSRLFIVEQRPDKPLGGNGLMLPSIEGGGNASMGSQASAPKTAVTSPSILPNRGAMGNKSSAYQPQGAYMLN